MTNTVPSIVFYYFDGQRSNGFPKSFQSSRLAEASGCREHYREREAFLQLPYSLEQRRKMARGFPGPATWQENQDPSIAWKCIPLEKLGAGRSYLCQVRERMSYICCVDAASPEPLLFKRKQAEELVHEFPNNLDPTLSP